MFFSYIPLEERRVLCHIRDSIFTGKVMPEYFDDDGSLTLSFDQFARVLSFIKFIYNQHSGEGFSSKDKMRSTVRLFCAFEATSVVSQRRDGDRDNTDQEKAKLLKIDLINQLDDELKELTEFEKKENKRTIILATGKKLRQRITREKSSSPDCPHCSSLHINYRLKQVTLFTSKLHTQHE